MYNVASQQKQLWRDPCLQITSLIYCNPNYSHFSKITSWTLFLVEKTECHKSTLIQLDVCLHLFFAWMKTTLAHSSKTIENILNVSLLFETQLFWNGFFKPSLFLWNLYTIHMFKFCDIRCFMTCDTAYLLMVPTILFYRNSLIGGQLLTLRKPSWASLRCCLHIGVTTEC